ncbi:MAG: PAS domain-containing sensor histidine kinase [Xanthobacteraceae bacterium]|nr:PAS domain-containing sensor histidine kinase [Xanthobacteraceae bacterium]
MKPSRQIGDYLDALVHPSARQDALTAAYHRAFIAPRLTWGLSALALLPIVLALGGLTTLPEVVLISCAIVPVAAACYLSRTGRYESATLISVFGLAAIAATVAACSGGMGSTAAVWLMLIPLEAAVSRSRRVVLISAALASAVAASLMMLPPIEAFAGATSLTAPTIGSALLYATAIALGAQRIVRTDAKLRAAADERAHLLTRNMSEVITRLDADGRVLSASGNAQEVVGIGTADLVGLGLVDRIVASDRAAFREAVAETAASGVERSLEFRIHRPKLGDEGCIRWIAMHCEPLPESAAGAVVAVLRDVTASRALQSELVDTRGEAERSISRKNRLLAVVGHELRTPLNAIIGFSEMLTDADEMRIDGARRKEYARLISEAGGHLLALANSMLDASRLDSDDFSIVPQAFAPAAVIAACCDLLALEAKRSDVALDARVPPQLPDIVADPHAMKQIVINLVANALKFTNRGGSVRIDAAVEGQSFVLSVADTGIGIAPEHFGRLGDPFFQVRGTQTRARDGSGLGLSIVKGLARLHGGDVEVLSRVGEGTRVIVRLPLDCERRPASSPGRMIARPGDVQHPATSPYAAQPPSRFKVSLKRSA